MEKNTDETILDSRVYELSYILVPTLSEDAALEKVNAIKQSIAALGGSFVSEETAYPRELAYEMTRVIKNTNVRFMDGYFGWIKFELDPTKLPIIDKSVKLDEDIIRYMTLKADRNVDIFTKRNPVVKSPRMTEDGEIVSAEEVVAANTVDTTPSVEAK